MYMGLTNIRDEKSGPRYFPYGMYMASTSCIRDEKFFYRDFLYGMYMA
jgi:hypothetical protein